MRHRAHAAAPEMKSTEFHRIVPQSPDGAGSSYDVLINADLDGIITDWSAGAQRLLGYPSREILGKSLSILLPPERTEVVPHFKVRIARGAHIHHYETQLVGMDGRAAAVCLTVIPVRNASGLVTGSSLRARGLSERSESDIMFRMAVEAAPNGMVMVDNEGRIVLLNARIEGLFGYTRDELLGLTVETLVPALLRDAHVEHRAEFSAHPGIRAMGAGRDILGRRKDGTTFPVEVGLNSFSIGEQKFVLASVIDITERQTAQETRLKSEILGWVTHEFNNALGLLTLSFHVLRVGEPKKSTAERLMAYGIIERALAKLKQNVANWLSNAKFESGRLVVNARKTRIGRIVDESLKTLRPLARYKNIRVRLSLSAAAKAGFAKADPDAISLIMSNLVSNAIKYTPAGGHIAVLVEPFNGRLRLSVKDDGIGIKPSDIPLILSQHRTQEGMRAAEGFGFGLKICQELLSQHGAQLCVDSAPGRGSTFSFTLPIWMVKPETIVQ